VVTALVLSHVGEIRDRKANGKGTTTSVNNGSTWTGYFVNNNPEGPGTAIHKDWNDLTNDKLITETPCVTIVDVET